MKRYVGEFDVDCFCKHYHLCKLVRWSPRAAKVVWMADLKVVTGCCGDVINPLGDWMWTLTREGGDEGSK